MCEPTVRRSERTPNKKEACMQCTADCNLSTIMSKEQDVTETAAESALTDENAIVATETGPEETTSHQEQQEKILDCSFEDVEPDNRWVELKNKIKKIKEDSDITFQNIEKDVDNLIKCNDDYKQQIKKLKVDNGYYKQRLAKAEEKIKDQKTLIQSLQSQKKRSENTIKHITTLGVSFLKECVPGDSNNN